MIPGYVQVPDDKVPETRHAMIYYSPNGPVDRKHLESPLVGFCVLG